VGRASGSGRGGDASSVPTVITVVLFVGSLLLFGKALTFDFVSLDDQQYVLENLDVQRGIGRDSPLWILGYSHYASWHPLTTLSHVLDYQWFGRDASGHHAVSVLLHAVGSVLAFLALNRLTGAPWASAACAAFFAWHPLRAESVAWVSERKDVLSGVFFFATLWAYAGYARGGIAARASRSGWYVLALLAFLLGLLSKSMLVTLPFVLLLLDFWPLRRLASDDPSGSGSAGSPRSAAWLVVEKAPFFALSLLVAVVTYRVQDAGGATLFALPLDLRLANAFVSIVAYVRDTVWPSALAVQYPYPRGYAPMVVLGALASCVAVTAVALWQIRRRPWLLVGWLWFVGMLVPVLGLVQVGMQPRADRYTYLPSIGLLIAAVWGARDLLAGERHRRALVASSALLLATYAVLTWRQVQVWRDSVSLFENAVEVADESYFAHAYLADALLAAGRNPEAEQQFRRVLELEPAHVAERERRENGYAVRYGLGLALMNQQRLGEAGEQFAVVLDAVEDYRDANSHYGVILAMQGRLDEARRRFETAVRLQPDGAPAHANLAKLLALQGELDAALVLYRRALALQPDDPATHCNLAEALAAKQLTEQAAGHREHARQLVGDPSYCRPAGEPTS